MGQTPGGVYQLAFIELQQPVSHVKIPVIVGDHDHPFPTRPEPRQQLTVKDLFVLRILIGRPFIENIKRPIFQHRRHERQPLPLPLRQIDR